jgi:hypothetical protein
LPSSSELTAGRNATNTLRASGVHLDRKTICVGEIDERQRSQRGHGRPRDREDPVRWTDAAFRSRLRQYRKRCTFGWEGAAALKMRISGGFVPETNEATAAGAVGRAADEGGRPRSVHFAYALAVIWVVIGFLLYTFQMLKLIGALG